MPWWWRRRGKQQEQSRKQQTELAERRATDTALDVANLAVGGATLGVATATLTAVDDLQAEIGALARQTDPTAPTWFTRRVFVSSTFLDLHQHRALLRHSLISEYQLPVAMEDFGASGTDATTVSKAEVEISDFFVLLVAWRYGTIPQGATRSITHQEYELARRLGKPIFIFLADPSTEADDGPNALFPASTRNAAYAQQLTDFRAELADITRHVPAHFTIPEDLALKVVTSLNRHVRRTSGAVAGQANVLGRIVALAEMPRHGRFIGRDTELAHLLQRLRAGDDIGIFALAGMGVGKTALAAEAVTHLAQDATIFPGGVAWVDCTSMTDANGGLATIVERMARALGLADVLAQTDPDQRRVALAAALTIRPPTLLTLDNLEQGLDAEATLQTLAHQGHTTMLLTAREHVALHLLDSLVVPPLPAPDATTLFAKRLGQATARERPTEAERADISPIVEAVGGLPKAVELLAAFAGGQHTALATLRVDLAHEGINVATFRANPRDTLMKTFARSSLGSRCSQGRASRVRRRWPWLWLLPNASPPPSQRRTLRTRQMQMRRAIWLP